MVITDDITASAKNRTIKQLQLPLHSKLKTSLITDRYTAWHSILAIIIIVHRYNMTIAWTSASKGTLFAQVRGNLSTNTTTEKSAIRNILPSKLKLAQPGLCSVLLVVYVVLYKNKQHSCHLWLLLCWLTRRLCPKLCRALSWCCCLCARRAINCPLLATGSKYISTLHRAEQSKVLSHGHRILLPASAALRSVAQELEMSDDFSEKKSPTLYYSLIDPVDPADNICNM